MANTATRPPHRRSRFAIRLFLFGVALSLLSIGGLALLPKLEYAALADTRYIAGLLAAESTPTLTGSLIDRQAAVGTPAPTATPTPSPTPTNPPPPVIEWTEQEINALTWLCYYEVRGMGAVRNDACLSVISTVRARYAYNSGFRETDVISTLLGEGQFSFTFDPGQPAPDPSLRDLVIAYQYGARGSCTGYLYFDSIPGGPSLCVLSGGGQFIEFHNGW